MTTVTEYLLLNTPGDEHFIHTALIYRPADPWAVTLRFYPDSDKQVDWLISRELLSKGLVMDVGVGDVRVWPVDPDEIGIYLEDSSRNLELRCEKAELSSFLNLTCELVPYGQEADQVDIDAGLRELLSAEAGGDFLV